MMWSVTSCWDSCVPPLLPLSERSLNPTSTPRHIPLSLHIPLIVLRGAQPLSNLDTDIVDCFGDVAHKRPIVKGRLGTIKVQ